MFFTSNVWCSLRLLHLKTKGKQYKQNISPKSYKTEVKILANHDEHLISPEKSTEAQLGLQKHINDHILPITKIGNDKELEMRIYTLRSKLRGLNLQVPSSEKGPRVLDIFLKICLKGYSTKACNPFLWKITILNTFPWGLHIL